jgi:hypothetical protein
MKNSVFQMCGMEKFLQGRRGDTGFYLIFGGDVNAEKQGNLFCISSGIHYLCSVI